MIDVKKVGLFIAECRKSRNWTQKQLGEKLGVTDRAVSKWETGRSLPDISLIEDICELFEIQVSELLAGKKIEEEEYKKETEQMLIKAIGENQLYGFQVVLYLLEISGLLAFYIPFYLSKGLKLRLNMEMVLCWGIAFLVLCCTVYLDRKLPARQYRSSNLWIEICNSVGTFLLMVSYTMYRDDVLNMDKEEISLIAIVILVGMFFIVLMTVCKTKLKLFDSFHTKN